MKKVVLFFAVAIAAFSANAQVKFGAKAGINIAKLGGDVSNVDSKVGFVGGVNAQIGLSEAFAIQPEVLYSMEGAKSGSSKLNLDYINVPVLVKYTIPGTKGLGVYAGPQIGFLASAKSKSGSTTTDIKSQLKSTNFSGAFGAEYTFMECFVLSARYQAGFSDISKSTGSVKSNAFQITVGYTFGGKK